MTRLGTLIDYLRMWAERRPDQLLSRFVDIEGKTLESYSYQAFDARTRELAAFLASETGLRPGDRALLVYAPGLEMLAAFFACARLGVIAVPVSPPLPMAFESGLAKLSFIARDCQARAVLSTAEIRQLYQMLVVHRQGGALFAESAVPPDLPWFATDEARGFSGASVPDSPGQVLFLQYTSGSTNNPKGVIVSHDNVIENGLATLPQAPVAVTWLPQHHDMGFIGYYLFVLLQGGSTHGMSPADFLRRPSAWLRLISEVRGTHTAGPNFACEYCLREDKLPEAELQGVDLSSLDTVLVAAEPVRARTYTRFLKRFAAYGLRPEALVTAYGLAENTLCVSIRGRQILSLNKQALQKDSVRIEKALPENHNQVQLVSCGKPISGVALRVVEPRSGESLGEGRIGEIWLDGPSKGGGYWQRPELTEEMFRARISGDGEHGYLRTGDLGFLYEGEVFVCGRLKDLIIVRGVNCYPQDIEAVVEHVAPEVRGGCVVAFSFEHGEEEALCVVAEVRDARALPDGKALARAIRASCHLDPHTILFVSPRSIPKTTSGKVARAQTRALWSEGKLPALGSFVHVEHDGHTTPAAAGPVARFRYILESYDLTGEENCSFADVGIDSVTLAELRADVQRLLEERGAAELAEEVNTRLLQRLTVSTFFRLLREFQDGSDQPVAALRQGLAELRAEHEAYEIAQMRADAELRLPALPAETPMRAAPREVLLTGATGFLGPFLVSGLLRQTACRLHALVRAEDSAHGVDRIVAALRRAQLYTPALEAEVRARVRVVCGDLARPRLGLDEVTWGRLAESTDAVLHNGALVNYVRSYDALRSANVDGTREALRLAAEGRRKPFHLVSSTFIYGWSTRPIVDETDGNEEMEGLDFGYSQTKWVAEQLAFAAQRAGLDVRIYRPSLISPTSAGYGNAEDILVRLLAFMIQHRLGIHAGNQISLLPADLVADHIVSIFGLRETPGSVFNITADRYYNIADITQLLSERHGYSFTPHDIPSFVEQMNRRCTRRDSLYPLCDFLRRSSGKIAAMQQKRYGNAQYRSARTLAGVRLREPALADTVQDLVRFMRRERLIEDARNGREGATSSDARAEA